jgi:hypothetical protein
MNLEECLKIVADARAKGERPNLSGANLRGADLRGADLSGANLSGANLSDACLSGANLRGADLRGADLSGADLSGAGLSDAYLSGANLSGANLRGADLSGANLSGANLSDAVGIELALARASHLPSDCPVVGWKKLANGKIAELQIPAKAKRSHGVSRKCRASEAKVLAIFEADGKTKAKSGVSQHDSSFVYVVGETVKPTEPFREDHWDECASGIHFFTTRIEAENY